MKRIGYCFSLNRILSVRCAQIFRLEEDSFGTGSPNAKKNYGEEGEVLTFTSVFSSFLVSVAGFTTVVSFFCSGGFTMVVLLSFFSAGGFVTVVSFCSQAARSAKLASMQIYFFIPLNRIVAPRVTPLSSRNIVRREGPPVPFCGQRIQILQVALISRAAVLRRAHYIPRFCSNGTQQHQDYYNHKNQAESAAGIVAPASAVRPGRQRSN